MWNDTFRGKSVLVTGHTGFKGSWLCLWMARLGARVTGYALEPPSNPNHFEVARIDEVLDQHHLADVRDVERLTQVVGTAKPDLILHLAAQTVVRRGYREPLETFSSNVMGTACVLEAVRTLRQPCAIVAVTSDKCYENREQPWGYRENDRLGDGDPYGSSKAGSELVVRSYRETFFPPDRMKEHGVRLASARAGNVIGGGDWTEDALMVDLVRSVSSGTTIDIRSPQAVRPWQHVLQALSGYLTLSARLLDSDPSRWCSAWNFGPLPGDEISVSRFVERFFAHWGTGAWRDASADAPHREAGILRICIDKALWELGWQPCWSIDEMLAHTAAWYRHWLAGTVDMQQIAYEQIAAYEQAMQTASTEPDAGPI